MIGIAQVARLFVTGAVGLPAPAVRWHAAALGLFVEGYRGLRPVPWVLVDVGDRLAVGGHGPHDDVKYLALALIALLELPVAELFQRDKRVIRIVLRRVLLAVEFRVGHSPVRRHLEAVV